MITKENYKILIEGINLGNSVAENDDLLELARVETTMFDDVLNGKYDLISGGKGAGKTAIFKLIKILAKFLYTQKNTIVISGVNVSGESLFVEYSDKLKTFSEDEFENFWKIYFITLIYDNFINHKFFSEKLKPVTKEINEFKNACFEAGLPDVPKVENLIDRMRWIMNLFKDKKVKKIKLNASATVTPEMNSLFSIAPEIEFQDGNSDISDENIKKAIYVNKIGIKLAEILKKTGLSIWIILDRLDEVFERYSMVEFNGLRGLLKAYKSFKIGEDGDKSFSVKIFIRDDLITFLSDEKEFNRYYPGKKLVPLSAATHIFSKKSPILSWSQDEVEQLILKRLLVNPKVRDYLNIDESKIADKDQLEIELKKLLKDKTKRIECLNKIFPSKIGNELIMKWIYSHLKDSKGVVTPRSVIDMLEGAKNFQIRKIEVDFKDYNEIFPYEALTDGVDQASKHKLQLEIYNEFPGMKVYIEKLGKEGKFKLTKTELQRIFGKKWEDTVDRLSKIGILKYVKESDSYTIVYLFRPALNISYKH